MENNIDIEIIIEKHLIQIFNKGQLINQTPRDILSLKIFSHFNIYPKIKNSNFIFKIVIFFYLILFIFFIILLNNLLSQYIPNYSFPNFVNISTPCLLPLIPHSQNLLLPPADCSICQNVKYIEKISNVSQEDFENKYAYTGHPVVITDAMINWIALKYFNFEFFKSIYTTDSPIFTNNNLCQFFPYKTKFKNLSEVFSTSEYRISLVNDGDPWYIGWGNCDGEAANILRSYYSKPYFLPEFSESSRIDWIFMGSSGYGAELHLDNVINPSWQAQVTGTKIWILKPPPECYYHCLHEYEVSLNPGEIIVVDTNKWFHSTKIISDDISISIGSEYD